MPDAGNAPSITARRCLFAAVVLGSIYSSLPDAQRELAPPEDQDICAALRRAPQYANLDYIDAYDV